MTDIELDFMNHGTKARLEGYFESWAMPVQCMYWAIVDKFNRLNEELG